MGFRNTHATYVYMQGKHTHKETHIRKDDIDVKAANNRITQILKPTDILNSACYTGSAVFSSIIFFLGKKKD